MKGIVVVQEFKNGKQQQGNYATVARVEVEVSGCDDYDDYGIEYSLGAATLDGCEISREQLVELISLHARGREEDDAAAERLINRALGHIYRGAVEVSV